MSLFVAVVALSVVMTRARTASAFELVGHNIIEASAYKRLLSLRLVPGTNVSGRTLLATLIAEGVLYQPRCFDPAKGCGVGGPLESPLAYWPVLGSGTMDLILNRQLNQEGQCQHFMAMTRDGLTPVDPRIGVPGGLADAYDRCAILAGVAFDRILRKPRLANWRLLGTYALMHAVEDSFSAAHVDRDARWKIVHLLSWKLIDWPAYWKRGIFSFPPNIHHAVSDKRDWEYLRTDARTEGGARCDTLANPYAVPESCLTPRALLAVSAVEDLLVDVYRLRAEAAGEGRTATLAAGSGATVWREYLGQHLASADVTADVPTSGTDGWPRPDLFVGARAIAYGTGWGVGLWGAQLLLGPAIPFALTVSASAGYAQIDRAKQLGVGAGVGLLLPLVRHIAIGALPAGVQVTCDTRFDDCSVEAVATVGNLIVPMGQHFWMGFEGPRWSWTARDFTGAWASVAFGWSRERVPEADPSAKEAALTWSPPRPDDVEAFRESRWTFQAFVDATAGATNENAFIGGGLTWLRDRDRWDRRSGVAPGLEVAADYGTINSNARVGAVTIAPLVAIYLMPSRLLVRAAPALVQLGDITSDGFGVDLAGRLGVGLDLGKVEFAVDSPPLSYLSRERWHALPISLRLGLLFD
jgi:hypothetical protein